MYTRRPDTFTLNSNVTLTSLASLTQALCTVRCGQLGLPRDSKETTFLSRACNVRSRTDPPLGPGYCGNGVMNVWTGM
jgi:hypothetical protein